MSIYELRAYGRHERRSRVQVRTRGNTLGDEPSAECKGDMGDLISIVFMRRRSGHKLLAGAPDLSCREACAKAVAGRLDLRRRAVASFEGAVHQEKPP